MNKVLKELMLDSERWDDPKYYGVVFVHPNDKEYLTNELLNTGGCTLHAQRNILTFENGGQLEITTLEQHGIVHHNYAGVEITTLIIDTEAFGKFDGEEFSRVSDVGNTEFIMYMLTRLRSPAECHSRGVIV